MRKYYFVGRCIKAVNALFAALAVILWILKNEWPRNVQFCSSKLLLALLHALVY
jgi:hypothetical protein